MIYLEKPENFNSKFEIVSCFFEYKDKILLLHRQDSKPQGNTWGMPAGKVEKGESALEAMVRELEEETGYKADKEELFFTKTVYVRYPEYDFVYHIYKLLLEEDYDVKIDPESHKGFEWVNPKDALIKNMIKDLDACIKLCYKV